LATHARDESEVENHAEPGNRTRNTGRQVISGNGDEAWEYFRNGPGLNRKGKCEMVTTEARSVEIEEARAVLEQLDEGRLIRG
jgi:hypothetical protein